MYLLVRRYSSDERENMGKNGFSLQVRKTSYYDVQYNSTWRESLRSIEYVFFSLRTIITHKTHLNLEVLVLQGQLIAFPPISILTLFSVSCKHNGMIVLCNKISIKQYIYQLKSLCQTIHSFGNALMGMKLDY